MDETHDPLEEAVPGAATTAGPRIGQDEWVARQEERRSRRGGWLGGLEERTRTVPWWAWLTTFVALVALLPVPFDSGYVRRVAFDTVLYMLLALGLNVVVGWGGLLDLGYIAFYGLGGYGYALLSSGKFDVHLPSLLTIPVVVAAVAVIGLLVGLPSWRLVGDYLAIVTLFFFQIFITVATNGDHLFGHDVTGGSNGISSLDPLNLFGHDLQVSAEGIFNVAYLYVALAFFVVVYVALRFVNDSRTGRAWRSLREDPLAAELMGMPVNWLKLLAFAFGAATAAFTGTLFAALNAGIFPQTFAFPLLITIYTMVILGGAGSQAGVVLGAVAISVLLEVLRSPGDSRAVFYAAIVLGLVAVYRLSARFALVLAGTAALGFVAHAVAGALHDTWVSGTTSGGAADAIAHWVIVPKDLASWVPAVSYVTLVALTLTLTLVRGRTRLALLVPTLYLAAFVWENVMLSKPEATRFIVLGAILVATMVARPAGLLGERRVEIV
ncbi:MAG TPA: branched-chain amino acid ABC transporter permease [Gaiellaceae bacterium]|jgi:branched-chain amino acid transport system permease protein